MLYSELFSCFVFGLGAWEAEGFEGALPLAFFEGGATIVDAVARAYVVAAEA